jgi:hypothetical protein
MGFSSSECHMKTRSGHRLPIEDATSASPLAQKSSKSK